MFTDHATLILGSGVFYCRNSTPLPHNYLKYSHDHLDPIVFYLLKRLKSVLIFKYPTSHYINQGKNRRFE